MRGFAILLVVAAHLIQKNIEDGIHNAAFSFINLFHMPLFFMISGYIGWKVSKPLEGAISLVRFIKKKVITLGIPLVVWTLIINYLFFTDRWRFPSMEAIVRVIINPGLWFLLTLLQIYIVYGVFLLMNTQYNATNKIWKDLCLFVVVGLLTSVYGLYLPSMSSIFLYTIFFYFGVMISKHKKFNDIVFNEWTFAIAFLAFCILCCHWNMHSGHMLDDFLKLITAPCAFIVIANVCRKYEKYRFANMISLWGRYSLEIYVIHWTLLFFLRNNHLSLEGVNNFWLFISSCIVALPILYLSIFFSKIVETSQILRLIMFGRIK